MDQVDLADIVVVLVAYRYGWVPSVDEGGDGKTSITWLEVEHARSGSKPVLPYLVDEEFPWPPKFIESANAEHLEEFKATLKGTIAGFFRDPPSLDGPISRDLPCAIERLHKERSLLEPPTRGRLLKSPRLYIADCGAPGALIADAAYRLSQVGLLVEKPVYSGYYLATEFYRRCDFGLIAFGSSASQRYAHVMEEGREVSLTIGVYFEPVDMTLTGYGAPVSGRVLSLEDWKYRPEACFEELLSAVNAELGERGWTSFRGELPDIELVDTTTWEHSRSWVQGLRRAGFTVGVPAAGTGQSAVPERLGAARLSLFAWGSKASDDCLQMALARARRGAAIIAAAETGIGVPQSLHDSCRVFDLRQDSPNKSPVGTQEWEAMLETMGQTLEASCALIRALAKEELRPAWRCS
jgi:hypothetical protein